MNTRRLVLAVLGISFVAAATLAGRELRPAVGDERRSHAIWTEVVPGVLRSRGTPHAYALVDGSRALVIDLPQAELLNALEQQRVEAETVLLTHHHRHTADGAVAAQRRGISVRGPKAESDLLTPEGVSKFWQESVPLRNSRTAYFVLAEGIPGIDVTLEDGGYAASARKILEIAPEWVLAEHGGPFEFNAEDFRRRAAWAESAAAAADRLCVSGDHRRDWDPHRLAIEPHLVTARPGGTLHLKIVRSTPTPARADANTRVVLPGRGFFRDSQFELPSEPADQPVEFSLELGRTVPIGRLVFSASIFVNDVLQASDACLVVDVQ